MWSKRFMHRLMISILPIIHCLILQMIFRRIEVNTYLLTKSTNIIFALADQHQDMGNIRETFFYNQMRVKNEVFRSDKADFNIKHITFEVGGKSKNLEQIKNLKNAYVVKDDIEYGYQNVVPLWAFGLNY